MRGESAMEHLADIGERVMHTYHVFNQGPWKVGSLEVHVEWPFQVANNKPQGKWLLYLEERPTVEGLLHFSLSINITFFFDGRPCFVNAHSVMCRESRLLALPWINEYASLIDYLQ